MAHTTRSSLRAAAVLSLSGLALTLVGCGGDVADDGANVSSAALTQARAFLVSFGGGAIPADADAVITGAGGNIVARYGGAGAVLARSSDPAFAGRLRAVNGVDAVGAVSAVSSRLERVKVARTPHQPHQPPAAGADPLSGRQWDMNQIRAPQARALSAGHRSVLVGVVDSGIDVTHPDLVGQVDTSASASCIGGVANTAAGVWSNDIIGHGTHVAGLIAAKKNGVGIVGVAPGVRLAALKVAVDDVNDPNFGLVFPDAIVCAIDWAIGHNFDLMNASLVIDPFTAPIDDIFCDDQPDRAAIVKIIRRAIARAGRERISVVAATGNFFTDLASLSGSTPGSRCRLLPVQVPRVIGVSAVGYTQKLAFYSNYGFRAVDLTAPGGDSLVPNAALPDISAAGQVLSSVPPGSLYYQAAADWDGQVQDCSAGPCATYVYLQGTSQAVPHVTGVAALALSRFGKLGPDALLAKLSNSATPLACPPSPYDPGQTGQPATCKGPPNRTNFYGAGEVDALAVLR
jgi:subtilisin family serine protease